MRKALNQPDSFDSTALEDQEDVLLFTLHEVDASKRESARRLWNPVIVVVIESIDQLETDREISRHKSKNRLLSSYIEKGESRVKSERK